MNTLKLSDETLNIIESKFEELLYRSVKRILRMKSLIGYNALPAGLEKTLPELQNFLDNLRKTDDGIDFSKQKDIIRLFRNYVEMLTRDDILGENAPLSKMKKGSYLKYFKNCYEEKEAVKKDLDEFYARRRTEMYKNFGISL